VLLHSRERHPCVLFSDKFPVWLPFLEELELEPVMVVTWSEEHLGLIEALVPDTCMIWCGNEWHRLELGASYFGKGRVLGLVDCQLVEAVFRIAELMSIFEIVSTLTPRRIPPHWLRRGKAIHQSQVGGVTLHYKMFTHLVKGGRWHSDMMDPPEVIPRDMSTALKSLKREGIFVRRLRSSPRLVCAK